MLVLRAPSAQHAACVIRMPGWLSVDCVGAHCAHAGLSTYGRARSNTELQAALTAEGIESDLDWEPYLKLVKKLKKQSKAVRTPTAEDTWTWNILITESLGRVAA